MPPLNLSLAPSSLTQTINPWNLSLGSLFTVNLGDSGDTVLEARILDRVGSYGRQLGRMGDALAVLIDHAALSGLSAAEQQALDALKVQLGDVSRLKRERDVELKQIKT